MELNTNKRIIKQPARFTVQAIDERTSGWQTLGYRAIATLMQAAHDHINAR